MMEELVPPVTTNFTVTASDPSQLAASQQKLVAWCGAKAAEAEHRIAELEDNLVIATRNKWRLTGIRSAITEQQRTITYFGKLQVALESGYFIIPNMDADVFVVRTAASAPPSKIDSTTSTWMRPSGRMPSAQLLPLGDGENVSANVTLQKSRAYKEQRDGKEVTVKEAWSTGFAEIDFPFSLAKVEILSATEQALVTKLFDEIASVPRRRRGDPMVIGRILHPTYKRTGKHVTFLIAWFLDTAMLD